MRYIGFVFSLVLFGAVWTFVSLILALPLTPLVTKYSKLELEGHPPNKRALMIVWFYNLLTWLPQAIAVAAATLATLERNPEAWRWLYFLTGFGACTPIGAYRERDTMGVSGHLMLIILDAVFLLCYFIPSLIPSVLWDLGSWIGR